MKDILIAGGWKFEGSCNCHGETSYTYAHPSRPNLRMEVTSSTFWAKQSNGVNWSTFQFGNQSHFSETLKKHWDL